MRLIALSGGFSVKVDDDDYDKLSSKNWWLFKNGKHKYARRMIDGKCLLMHRMILGINNSTVIIDHKNMDGLDNRKENLRIVSRSENGANTIKHRGISKYKGVSLIKDTGRWRANGCITIDGIEKQCHLGVFDTQEEAAIAYNVFAHSTWGDCARLNIIEGVYV